MYGGQVLTRPWNGMCRIALHARKTANHPNWHLCTPGNGRISHADYAGPFMGHMFLIMIDAYSKWMEVYPTSSSTSAITIEKMREIFVTHSFPEQLVTDNGLYS